MLLLFTAIGSILACAGNPAPSTSQRTPLEAQELDYSERVPWRPFSVARVQALRGRPILIFVTADWSISAKVLDKRDFASQAVRDAMQRNGVVPLKADCTQKDPEITAWMQAHAYESVPVVVLVTEAGEFANVDLSQPGNLVAAMDEILVGGEERRGPTPR